MQHGGVEFVMQFFKHADQALGVDGFFFGGQVTARFQGFEHVVHACQRQAGVGSLLAFAVGVDLLGQLRDFVTQFGGEAGVFRWEGEGLKQRDFAYIGSLPTPIQPHVANVQAVWA